MDQQGAITSPQTSIPSKSHISTISNTRRVNLEALRAKEVQLSASVNSLIRSKRKLVKLKDLKPVAEYLKSPAKKSKKEPKKPPKPQQPAAQIKRLAPPMKPQDLPPKKQVNKARVSTQDFTQPAEIMMRTIRDSVPTL
jgi:hypothetical protein